MATSFEPQFHKRINRNKGTGQWIALPTPRTLIPVKSVFFQQWQIEERLRLQEAGEVVLQDSDE
jgi:hypothetical protein